MNHFADGDLVECTVAHPRYRYVAGDQYTVRNLTPCGTWTYVPDPNDPTNGMTCDGPWVLQHFILHQAAHPTPAFNINVGDMVVILAVDGTALPPGSLFDVARVVRVHPAPNTSIKPWVDVQWVRGSTTDTLRPDQYDWQPVNSVYGNVPNPRGPKTVTAPMNIVPVQGALTPTGAVAMQAGSGAFVGPFTIPELKWIGEPVPCDTPRCECGSDAVKSPRHSAWCPKHG